MSDAVLYRGRAGLAVMLSTRSVHGDLYDSFYALPVTWHAFSTERKLVRPGEGPMLRRFLEEPVHTGRDPNAVPSHRLPRWIYDEVESVVVQAGRSHWGYALELVGEGDPSVSWVLQRLLGRRGMHYLHRGSLVGRDIGQLRDAAADFQLAYWRHGVHFVLRMNAFASEEAMHAWVARHPHTSRPIERLLPPIHTAPFGLDSAAGKPWFESMGAYAPPCALALDDDAAEFAFRQLSNWQMLKAYWNRGPDQPILNFLNWPLEAYRLSWDRCPPGTALTRFECDLRFEVYG